ncbi:MAG: DUF1730 domain-containing protein, partial [Leptospira sp.]|nr:DUF1730 domain-containing protein [Leptospira sp.]
MEVEDRFKESKESNSILELKYIIHECNFELAGITDANIPDADQKNIQDFINRRFYASMNWFADRQNIRINFENLGFPVASIIMLAVIYKPKESDEKRLPHLHNKVSRYAWGEDYHEVLRDKAKPILEFLRNKFPGKKFRQGIDSLPIPEKILAREAGLGWIGKNTLLINENLGSYFFLTAILCEVDLTEESDSDIFREDSVFSNLIPKDRCGSCTACIDACPTQAIVAPYQLDAGKCISHHTIEYPEEEFP